MNMLSDANFLLSSMKEIDKKDNLKRMLYKSLSSDADSRHYHADLSGMESGTERNKTEYKKYIFKVTGKFSRTDNNR